jgi:hypothetical protein
LSSTTANWWAYEMIGYDNGDITSISPSAGQTVTSRATESQARALGARKGPIAATGNNTLTWTGWDATNDCYGSATLGVALRP